MIWENQALRYETSRNSILEKTGIIPFIEQLFEERTTARNRNEDEIVVYGDVPNIIHEGYEYFRLVHQLHRNLYKETELSFVVRFIIMKNYKSELKLNRKIVTRFSPFAPCQDTDKIQRISHRLFRFFKRIN